MTKKDGRIEMKPGNASLQSVMVTLAPESLFPAGVDMTMHGHVHLFEALSFASRHPATLVSGNGGTATDKTPPASLPLGSEPAPGAVVEAFHGSAEVGFLTMERNGTGWLLIEHDRTGKPSLRCTLQEKKLHCLPPA